MRDRAIQANTLQSENAVQEHANGASGPHDSQSADLLLCNTLRMGNQKTLRMGNQRM